MNYRYSKVYLNYMSQTSRYAASRIVDLCSELTPTSVLDLGCALGTWLAAWKEAGVDDIYGIDGDYVESAHLEIPEAKFLRADLSKHLCLQRRFDLVQSLEVAEHIAPEASSIFIDNLVSHAERYILFSAAVPGQGGESHVNERPHEFWRDLFIERGFQACDFVRPKILRDRAVPPWYRYNILLFVRQKALHASSGALQKSLIPTDQLILDVSPLPYRLRKLFVRCLPTQLQDQIAKLKARMYTNRI